MIFRLLLLICYFTIAPYAFAQNLSLNKFTIGDSRVQIDFDDFVIHNSHSQIKAFFETDTVQWLRNDKNLLSPRAILQIQIQSNEPTYLIQYKNQTLLPTKENGLFSFHTWVDLFNPEVIEVFNRGLLESEIKIEAKTTKESKSKQLIDYSCTPYNLRIDGIDSEYLSVGCRLGRLGHFGNERPRLEVTMSSTNLRTLNKTPPPYTLFLHDSSPVEIVMMGSNQKERKLTLQAQLPPRVQRLKTALGMGPYIYDSNERYETIKSGVAPSVMIYGKLDLTESSSFKFFDAALLERSYFNNSGLYYSYDIAEILDGRLVFNTLLGLQGLDYRFNQNSIHHSRVIYPQGFEAIYKHAFIENYHLTYGMFLSINTESYVNAWLRYGQRSFIELNYIKWGFEESGIGMWGLSVGVPFFSAF